MTLVLVGDRDSDRTNRFAVLGMSLSALLEIPAAHDFLRGLLSLVQEFDAVPDDKFDRKNVSAGSVARAYTESENSLGPKTDSLLP